MIDFYELLDSIQTMKDKRDSIVEMYDTKIKELSEVLEKQMSLIGQDKAESGNAIAYWRKGTSIDVADWDALSKYVTEHEAFDILQKRIAPAALQARLDAGEEIAGVTVKETKTFIVQRKGKK